MSIGVELLKKQTRENIQLLINDNKLDEALGLIDEYLKIDLHDIEIYSMKAVVLIMQGNMYESEIVLKKALSIDVKNFDLNYNLGYVYEKIGEFSFSLKHYKQALENCKNEEVKSSIINLIQEISNENDIISMENREKIVFFVKQGMDSFLEDIINGLSDKYETKKIIVTNYKQIDEGMQWADICWFEWCDELVQYGSNHKLAINKKIICRLHSYEAFAGYPNNVKWDMIDKIIFVGENIRKFTIDKYKIDSNKAVVIPNGVNTDRYIFKERKIGFNIAYVGYINYKKGPMLLLHTFKAIYDKDHRYKLYIAGQFQDDRDVLYFEQMIKEFGIENNVIYQGWQDNLDKWLENKNYIICTSILESQNMSVMQAMSKGIKPIIHNFVGARQIYGDKYVWNTIDEAVNKITENNYNSYKYRTFIQDNYCLYKQINEVRKCIKELEVKIENNIESFDYQAYWNNRLNSKFDIEGVGYIGLGKIYNHYLYKNRLDMLDYIFKNIFKNDKELSVLELGPGIGIFTEYFKSVGIKNYEAIDIAEKSVDELSRKYSKYKFINGDISKLDYYNKKYDLVFAADVLLHITIEENYKDTMLNISKSLKEHGICILLDPISVLNTKSESAHVVIRDKNYIEDILKDNDLELVQMIPVAFFMNYPFDKKLLGNNEETVLNLFKLISYIFSNNGLSDKEKELLGKYLLNKERQILFDKNFGLSEKLIIIKKKANKDKYNLVNINNIWSKSELVKEEQLILKKENISIEKYLNDLNNLISELYKDSLTLDYIINLFNKFSPYKVNNYNNYDFRFAQVVLGKREKINEDFEIIETVIINDSNNIIVINNIWLNIRDEKLTYPKEILESKNFYYINKIIQDIVKYNLNYNNNIAGFVFDENLIKDIKENYLSYMWERAIPASHFMPTLGYLRIAERYIFAGSFINNEDKVLEAPCGFGYGAAYFSDLCSKVEALDLADENISFGKNAYNFDNVNWLIGDVTKLPYKDNEFDVYISYEVFEHLPMKLIDIYLNEAKRIIKDGGKLIISTPNRETRKNINNPFHVKEYNFKEFNQLVKKYFNIVEYYSVSNFKVEKGMSDLAFNIIAVCIK